MARPRKWKPYKMSHPNPPQFCTGKHAEAAVWRNSGDEWFLSVSGVAATEAEAKRLAVVLMDELTRCKKDA